MRVSTISFYNASLSGIQDQQSRLGELSRKIAENRSYLTAREAPLNASRAMELSSSLALRTQYMANQDKAELTLKYENVQLDQLRASLLGARDVLDSANASQDQNLRDLAASHLANLYSLAKDIGNARDVMGNHIFSGHETATQPYGHTAIYPASLPASANTTSYSGDGGSRAVTIDTGRSVTTNDNLYTVYRGDGTAGQDLLGTLDYAAAALHDPAASGASVAAAISAALDALDNSLGALHGVQIQVSSRLVEISDARASAKQLMNTEQGALATLNELDLNAAIIELQMRQTNLEASRQTFAMVSDMSLFSYLG